jgi:hypothetical protein
VTMRVTQRSDSWHYGEILNCYTMPEAKIRAADLI